MSCRRCLPSLLTFLLALVSARSLPAVEPLKVLLVTGGCCHDYDTQKGLIKEGLEDRAHVQVTVVNQGGSGTNAKIPLYDSADWAKGYDVVIHDECFADVNDSAWIERILTPHRQGLPAVVVHCAMHCYRDGSDKWFEFCGVTSRQHGDAYPHEVLNVDAAHPIMRGFGPAWGNPAGELYWIEKVWPTAHVLGTAKNRQRGSDEACVWTNDYRGTRVFGTTLGHHNETVEHPAFMSLLTRGTLWACGKLKDDYLKPQRPRLAPVNLAQGKTATASSEESGKSNFARNAVDGDPSTRWCAAGPDAPQWLMIDLGRPERLTGSLLKWESSGGVYRYRIEGSADGRAWQMLADKSEEPGRDYRDRFDADARYVRVTFLGSDGGGWGSLWEVSLFGDQMREVQPQKMAEEADQSHLADVKAPDGFDVTLFASPPAVNYPVCVAADLDGTLYVSSDKNGSLDRHPNRGSVLRLRDLDGDGRADQAQRFVANVDSPRGLVWDHDRLYLMHPPHLSAFIDHDGDGVADEQQMLVKNIAFGFKDRPADHASNGVTLGIDGWLYLAIGDFGFLEAEGADGRKLQLRGGGVVRVRPDGAGLELYSRGTRNILEVALDPLLNGFARDNTNDGDGWDIRLHHFTGLEEHGYPSLFKHFSKETIAPLDDYGGGSGVGALFVDEPGFPEGYGHALYTADWGREFVFRHPLEPHGATVKAEQSEFVRLPRVTDLDVDGQSRLYATSWKGATFTYAGEDVGYLIRVTPQGYRPEPLPDFERAGSEELIGWLRSASHRWRLEAQRTLLRRGLNEESTAALLKLAADDSQPLASRVAAVFALKQGLGANSHEWLAKLAGEPAIRPFIIRALADRQDQLAAVPVELLIAGLEDENPRTRLEAAVALARLGRDRLKGSQATEKLSQRLDDADPVVAHTVARALLRLQAVDACLAVVDNNDAAIAPRRDAALRVLAVLHQPDAVKGLMERVQSETKPVRRQGLLTALCRLYFREGEWKGNSWGTRPDTSGPYYQPEKWESTGAIEAALKSALERADASQSAYLLAELSRHKIHFAENLALLLEMARRDPEMAPLAIAELAQSDRLPVEAAPLALSALRSSAAAPDVRLQAARALLRSDNEGTFAAVLAVLPEVEKSAGNSREFNRLVGSLTNTALVCRHVEFLARKAGEVDGRESFWAEALLMLASVRKDAPPEARALASRDLAEGWKNEERREQILQVIQQRNYREFEPQVREALRGGNPQVAALAQMIAAQWKLTDRPTPAGPPLKSLKTEDVLAEVLKRQGDVGLGQQLFTQLNCAKCHTTQADEPPRGPYLANVAKTYKRAQLAEAVLLPSKSIAQGFATNVFVLEDGTTVTGFVTNEAADAVTIRDGEGREIRLPVDAIEEREKKEVSAMPEGLVKDLSLDAFCSLISYLESLAGAAK